MNQRKKPKLTKDERRSQEPTRTEAISGHGERCACIRCRANRATEGTQR
jgi:hypothetical protein